MIDAFDATIRGIELPTVDCPTHGETLSTRVSFTHREEVIDVCLDCMYYAVLGLKGAVLRD